MSFVDGRNLSLLKNDSCILLFSGGIDSFVAWHYLGHPQTLFFYARTRYSNKEFKIVKELIPNTIIDQSLDLHDREYGEKAYIPFRNLIFFLQATKYSDHIVLAGVADDQVSDKNEKAFKDFSRLAFKLEGRPVKLTSPFWKMTKKQVIQWYLNNIGDVPTLLKTTSCYHPAGHYCGRCPSCFRKWCALWANKIYLEFSNQELMDQYLQSANAKKYLPERNQDIVEAVNAYRSRH